MSTKQYLNFMGGEGRPSRSGKTFQNINPADHSDVVGEFPASNAADVDLAVTAAKKEVGSWRLGPAPKRAEILYRAGELVKERKEEYARQMTREMGKGLSETLGDVQEAI